VHPRVPVPEPATPALGWTQTLGWATAACQCCLVAFEDERELIRDMFQRRRRHRDDDIGSSSHAGHGHRHVGAPRIRPSIVRALWVAVAGCAVLTIAGLIALWPGDRGGVEDPLLLDADPIDAEVITVTAVTCSYGADECELVGFDMDDGPYAGETGAMELADGSGLSVGDGIRVLAFETEGGQVVYSFYEYERSRSLVVLAIVFAVAVVLLGRWRGVGALAGLVFSLVVILVFTLPALLDGASPTGVALVTAALVAFAALFLAHGLTVSTAVALLSTLASLLLTVVLAWLFVDAANLTGLTDDSSTLLSGIAEGIDARGILLAGIMIGSLGVLDDVTVTQVSAVWELRHAQPTVSARQLAAPALRVGRDHVSSTVNTLFLAYVGAALPLLLLFTQAGQSFGDVATREIVATEIVRALVGSVGLVASVPISTWLAALVVTAQGPDQP
jgi:uncharacterized membrane protein